MKKIGQFCALVILTLSITVTSYAGHIDCPGVTSEPPQVTGETPNNVTGEMQNGVESSGTFSDTLLILIEGVFLVV